MNDTSEVKLHFLDYWRVIRLRWGIVLLAFLLVEITAGVTCYFLPREYYSKTTLEIKPDNFKGVSDGFQPSSVNGTTDPRFVQTQFQIIQRAEILYPVIDRLRLDERWASGGPKLTKVDAHARLLRKLELHDIRNTDLIEIGTWDTDSQQAANIANTIASVYIEKRKKIQAEMVDQGLKQLDDSVATRRRSMQEAKARADKIRTENGFIDPDPENMNSQELKMNAVQDYTKLVNDTKARVAALKTQLQKIEETKPEELPTLLDTIGMPNPTISKLVGQLHDAASMLVLQRNAGLGDNHPKIKATEGQIDLFQRQLSEQIDSVRKSLEAKLSIENGTLAEYEAKLAGSENEFTESKKKTAEYLDAKSAYITARKLYETMQVTLDVERSKINVQTIPAQIYEMAAPAPLPGRPKIAAYMGLASIFGIILGFGLAFFLEYLDTSVKTLDDVEKFLALPVLAVIPKNVGLLHKHPVDSPDAEAYRILRTNIEFNRKNPDANTITIVSGGAGEGKSTTLCNLAYTCARGGYNVLLIDADLRRPSLHKAFDMDNTVGLTNYLTSKMDFAEVVRQTPFENLSFIPSGILPSDAVGILNSQRMVDLIADVKRKYDLVFFDSPPILGVSDASILASEVDITVMVVQHRRFPRSMLQRVKQAVVNVGGNLLGVVLNNVDTRQDSGYQYYTSYYEYYSPEHSQKGPSKPRLEPVKVPAARTARPGQIAEY